MQLIRRLHQPLCHELTRIHLLFTKNNLTYLLIQVVNFINFKQLIVLLNCIHIILPAIVLILVLNFHFICFSCILLFNNNLLYILIQKSWCRRPAAYISKRILLIIWQIDRFIYWFYSRMPLVVAIWLLDIEGIILLCWRDLAFSLVMMEVLGLLVDVELVFQIHIIVVYFVTQILQRLLTRSCYHKLCNLAPIRRKLIIILIHLLVWINLILFFLKWHEHVLFVFFLKECFIKRAPLVHE